MDTIRTIALFIVLVARALVVSANAFGLGIFFVSFFLSSNREHCYPTWFTIVPGVGDWVCMDRYPFFEVSRYLLSCVLIVFVFCRVWKNWAFQCLCHAPCLLGWLKKKKIIYCAFLVEKHVGYVIFRKWRPKGNSDCTWY